MSEPADLPEVTQRVETDRFGPFVFRTGLSAADLQVPLQRVDDAHERFVASPLSQVANALEREVVVSSVFGTNTIEGGTLTEEQTGDVLALDPDQVREIEQRRVVNVRDAYDLAKREADRPDWAPDLAFVLELHRKVTQDLPHPDNRPGLLRDNPERRITYVGDEAHGGRYKPPQYGGDVARLLEALLAWHADLQAAGVPALVRAPLVHLYFEQIHPFWDGNGRVGRVIEAALLQAAGYRYAPFALARYYLDQVDEYFTLFNSCRKAVAKGAACPNQPFVAFHLEGMRLTINSLHDRVNRLVSMLLFESTVRRALDEKQINARQYAIVSHLLERGRPLTLAELRGLPWYNGLYLKLSDKTRVRDLHGLREAGLVQVDERHRLWPGFMAPGQGAG